MSTQVSVCVCVCVCATQYLHVYNIHIQVLTGGLYNIIPLRAPLLSLNSSFFVDDGLELRVTVRTEPLPLTPTAGLPALVPSMVSKSSFHARVCCVCARGRRGGRVVKGNISNRRNRPNLTQHHPMPLMRCGRYLSLGLSLF